MPPLPYPPSGSDAPIDGRRGSDSHPPTPTLSDMARLLPDRLQPRRTGPLPHVQPSLDSQQMPPPSLMPPFAVAPDPATLAVQPPFVNPSQPLQMYDPALALYNLAPSTAPFVFEDPSFGRPIAGPSYTTGAYAVPSPWSTNHPLSPVLTPPSSNLASPRSRLSVDVSPESPLRGSSSNSKPASASSSPQVQQWTCHWIEEPGGPECGKVFTRPYDLTRHQMTLRHATQAELMGLTEGGEEPVKKKRKKPGTGDFICLDCQIGFSRRDSLQRHCRTRDHRPAP